MADYQTMRTAGTAGVRTAAIDEGLRAHMNKVYGTMSVGMLVTAGVVVGGGHHRRPFSSIFRDPGDAVSRTSSAGSVDVRCR
jgi:uncharacterized protein